MSVWGGSQMRCDFEFNEVARGEKYRQIYMQLDLRSLAMKLVALASY
jgi:hypothetical protein